MTDTAHTLNIDQVEQRRDELTDRYVSVFRDHNASVELMPGRADLRTMDDRKDAATADTEAARDDQRAVSEQLVEVAEQAVEWANGVLAGGDYSNGLDGLDNAALVKVFDRAIIRGDHARALAAAQLLEADGDNGRAMHLLAVQDADIRVALDYLDAYADPTAILTPLRSATVQIPDDSRIAPSVEVARRIEREDAEIRAAEQAADLAARMERDKRLSGPIFPLHSSVRKAPARARRAGVGPSPVAS